MPDMPQSLECWSVNYLPFDRSYSYVSVDAVVNVLLEYYTHYSDNLALMNPCLRRSSYAFFTSSSLNFPGLDSCRSTMTCFESDGLGYAGSFMTVGEAASSSQ